MVKRDGATARDYAETTEKVLTAVKGAWSPARPARRTDAQDDAEAFLSPGGKIRGSVSLKKDLEDVAAWNVPLPKPLRSRQLVRQARKKRKPKTSTTTILWHLSPPRRWIPWERRSRAIAALGVDDRRVRRQGWQGWQVTGRLQVQVIGR